MSEALEKIEDGFLEKINHICREFGLNNIMAQLYAILYFNDKPLSLDDMVERLRISKGSASINMRVLERYGAVRRVWVKGSRRDYYEAEADISKVIFDRITSMAHKRLFEVKNMIEESSRAADSVNASSEEEKKDIKVFKQRLDRLKNLHGRAQSLFNVFNSGFVSNILMTKARKRADKNETAPIEQR
jgi:DNA-binding transcriptional regulator GbsR (MarR family)